MRRHVNNAHPTSDVQPTSLSSELEELPANIAENNSIFKREKKYRCSKCSCIYLSAKKLNDHVKRTHEALRPYKCPTCGKEFLQKKNMVMHMKCHEVNHYKL